MTLKPPETTQGTVRGKPGTVAPTTLPTPVLAGPDRSQVTAGPIRRTMLWLALPVLAEQLLNTFVGLFDTFLAGRISPAATSAIGLASYVDWLASMLFMLVATGTTALVARHEGAGNHAEANHFANQSLTLAALLGVVVAVLVFSLAPFFAWYCRMEGEAYDITVTYLRIDAMGYLIASITFVGCAALRGVGNMRTPMIIFAVINVVNVIASYSFVYGIGPIPPLGVTGIVVGTVTARVLGGLVTVAVLAKGGAGLRVILRELPIAWHRTWRILRIGIPAAADGAIMWSGHFLFLAIISRLADDPLGRAYFAAHIVAVRVEAFSYLPAMAWAAATATMIGQALGAGLPDRARRVGHEGVRQSVSLNLLVAVAFFAFAPGVYQIMTADALVREVGILPFRFLALFQPILVASIVYIGGLRGAGDTRYPMVLTLVGTILIRLPLGYLFGIVFGWGLLGAWIGMFADNTMRAVGAFLRFLRGKWIETKV
jgi:multidrug resistance protein, MATE family